TAGARGRVPARGGTGPAGRGGRPRPGRDRGRVGDRRGVGRGTGGTVGRRVPGGTHRPPRRRVPHGRTGAARRGLARPGGGVLGDPVRVRLQELPDRVVVSRCLAPGGVRQPQAGTGALS